MAAYSALGLTFTLIIPFIIVLVFTSKLIATTYLSAQKVLVQRIIWAVYTIFVFYYLMTSERSSELLNWIIAAILFLSILITIFNKPFIKFVRKVHDDVKKANANARMQEERLKAIETNQTALLQRIAADKKQAARTQEKLMKDVDRLYGSDASGYY